MTTPGSPLIAKKLARSNRADLDRYLFIVAVGILSGIAVTYARTPMHLPGHKALWWMAPILATRLLTRRRAGGSGGAIAAAVSTILLGGRIAGGTAYTPLIILAGGVLDLAVRFIERST